MYTKYPGENWEYYTREAAFFQAALPGSGPVLTG